MKDSRLVSVTRSTADLPHDQPLRRLPRAPTRSRTQVFFDRFEDRALVYDCFWHDDGARILCVGPPPLNLAPHYAAMRCTALPSGTVLVARRHVSLSTMITELIGAPAGTTTVRLELAGTTHELPVGTSHAADFAGRRLLFAMSKDNDLGWIAEWARWHAGLHGTDAVVLFDNGSTRYGLSQIEDALLAVPGLERVAVAGWPGRFGMTDPALRVNPYWSHFLQISAMSVALRRFAPRARGLLNCDIDELVATRSGRPVYEHLAAARRGLVVFRGQWVEATGAGPDHRAFTRRQRDPQAARSGPKKWVLDPRRDWVQNLAVHPYWHWVRGRPWFGKTMPADVFYRHFKGINTNWKEARMTPVADAGLETDTALAADFARLHGHG